MSDWIDEEARRIGGGAQGQRQQQGQPGGAGAAAGAGADAWESLRAKVREDVGRINEKLAGRLGGDLRFAEPGAGAFEVRRTGRQGVTLRVTRVEGFVIVKYTKMGGDADTHRTEEFRRLEIDADESGRPCLKARDGQLLCLEDASQHLLTPLLG